MNTLEPMPVRRIVTGHDEAGKAVVTTVAEPPTVISFPAMPGTFFFEMWKTNATPAIVDNGADPTLGPRQMGPATNGCAVRIVQIAPERDTKLPSTPEEMAAHFREAGAPAAATSGTASPHPLMHRTETLDFGILIDGELTLILDDSEVQLRPGDLVVQRGTNHAWSNRGEVPCRIAFVLLDGRYDDEVKRGLEQRSGA